MTEEVLFLLYTWRRVLLSPQSMSHSLDSVSKLEVSSFLGWCNADPSAFYSLTSWLNSANLRQELEVRKRVLARYLLNNLLCVTQDYGRFLTKRYVYACGTIAAVLFERDETNDVVSEPLASNMIEVLTILSGRVLLYTPADYFIFIRENDSTITRGESIEVKRLLLLLSTHPSYFRVRPSELAVAIIFYCRLALGGDVSIGLVLTKKGYRYSFSDSLPTIKVVHGMILTMELDQEKTLLVRDLVPSYLESNLAPSRAKVTIRTKCTDLTESSSLGSGEHGQVYRAHSGRTAVAVKVQQWSGSIMREIAVMSTLSHPNLQSARSFCIEGGEARIYMTVQQSLFSKIYSSHQMDDTDAVQRRVWMEGNPSPFKVIDLPTRRSYARQLLKGLVYLAEVGIIHGDIKPDNLLISQAGVLKITDFGLSFLYTTSREYEDSVSMLLYAPGYRDPNIDQKWKTISYEADVWAAAVTILEMETGILPLLTRRDPEMRCVSDRKLARVCSQMLLENVQQRIDAKQALLAFE